MAVDEVGISLGQQPGAGRCSACPAFADGLFSFLQITAKSLGLSVSYSA